MNAEKARKIFESINKSSRDVELLDLKRTAIRYAQMRTKRLLAALDKDELTQEENNNIEDERTRLHNLFIQSCSVLCRNMYQNGEDNTLLLELVKDGKNLSSEERKIIGDLACYIHCMLAIQSR